MKIPEQVKVGGKVYRVSITEHLSLGNMNCSAEIDYRNLEIRICAQAEQKMQEDLMHELCHAIYSHLGYYDHDEKKIQELASSLYMVICDNPAIFVIEEGGTDDG